MYHELPLQLTGVEHGPYDATSEAREKGDLSNRTECGGRLWFLSCWVK